MTILKNISYISFVILISLSIISCKKEIKKEPAQFSIEPKTITVNWTGYKTTDKIAVNGKFEEINIPNIKNAT